MKLLGWLVRSIVCFMLVSTAAPAFADDEGPDIVLLKNGGRLRGTVVEENPSTGVRIKLPTGTIKTVAAKEVDKVEYGGGRATGAPSGTPPSPSTTPPAPPADAQPAPLPPLAEAAPTAATGSIHVVAAEPGTISVDGGEVGPAPVDVRNLAPGPHRVHIAFDAGGKGDVTVLVQEGETKEVRMALSSARLAGAARAGVRPFVGAEPYFVVDANGFNGDTVGGGVRLVGGMNLGIVPAVDFRAAGVVGLGKEIGTFSIPIMARPSFRFNLGSIYSMEVGGHVGFILLPTAFPNAPIYSIFGPDLSVLSFRFGAKRQYELTEMTSIDLIDADALIEVANSIGFSWVIPN